MVANQIVKHENGSIINSMDDAERAARAMVASGFFTDAKQLSQAVVKILAGQELGFGPFASMTGVNIIQNKPVLAANLMAAAVKRQGKYNYRVISLTNDGCELAFLENGQEVGRSTFDKSDAEKAQLLNKDNWRKWPRNMYFARALSNGQKWYAPDVFNGATVYTPDELGARVDEEGNAVIDAVATTAPAQPEPNPFGEPAPSTPAPATPPDPEEAAYNAALALWATVGPEKKKIQYGAMTKAQLEYVATSSKDTARVDAALLILEKKFSMQRPGTA